MINELELLKEKIVSLESELVRKNAELTLYRSELAKANQILERMIGQVNSEIKTGQALQRFLSPTELPNISGFEFSTKFIPGSRSGGDYFDIFEHEDKLKFGVLIASCSGYTMSALLLSVVIKISSQIEARRGLGPDQVMALIAKEIVPNIQNKDKASLFYGIVDRRTYEMQYSVMGGIDGFLQVYGQEGLQELNTSGAAFSKETQVGKIVNSPSLPTVFQMQLNPRDRLVLATEGLKGSENADGQMWGKNGLADAVKKSPKQGVHELRNEILFANEKFTGSIEPVRDQTLLVIEVKDRVIKLASR